MSIHPWWGSLVAALVLAASLCLVRLIGEFLIGGAVMIVGEPWLEVPFGTELLFERGLAPLLARLSVALGPDTFLHRLLIGGLVAGRIDFSQSFGLLVPLELTTKQLVIGSVLLSMFFPCLATLVVLFRELGLPGGLKSAAVMLAAVIGVAGALNLIL